MKYVRPSKTMTDEEFVAHMNKHHTPIAGLTRVRANMSDSVVAALRAYHKRVHRQGHEDNPPRELTHGHRTPRPKPEPLEVIDAGHEGEPFDPQPLQEFGYDRDG